MVTTVPEEAAEDWAAPPADVAAEAEVLGAMMLRRDIIIDVTDKVTGVDFYRPWHQLVFEAVLALDAREEPTDPLAVFGELQRQGVSGRVPDGVVALFDLMSGVVSVVSAPYHAARVRDFAVRRRLIMAGSRITQLGRALDAGEPAAVVDAARVELDRVLTASATDGVVRAGSTIARTLDAIEEHASASGGPKGVPTGFRDLDSLTGGLHPGQLVIVAARPAVGKTTLAMDLCRSASIKHGMASVMFSLEMGLDEINMRLLSSEARVLLANLRSGRMEQAEWDRLAVVMARVTDAPFFVDDSPNITLTQIRAKCRRLQQQHGLRLVVLDYLQLMTSGRRVESRQQEVSEFSRGLKLLAKELGVPVVALSQLNRGPEQRQDKRPLLSDLRESGSLEQDADLVVLLHREDMYDRESPRAGEADLIVAKHRNGPTDTVTVTSQLHYSRFVDMAS